MQTFYLEKIYTRFSFGMSCSTPILLESGCSAYKLKTVRKQVLLTLMESMCSSHFVVWLHLSFQKTKSKHAHKERAAH